MRATSNYSTSELQRKHHTVLTLELGSTRAKLARERQRAILINLHLCVFYFYVHTVRVVQKETASATSQKPARCF